MLALEFIGFFLFFLIPGYILPAGQFYYLYHVRKDKSKEHLRIQHRRPTREQIRREVRLSLVSITIFAVMGTAAFQLYKAGMTNIYWGLGGYPVWYLPLSFFLCLILHDTYFYWTHRFMHWRPVFKYTHLGHHRSVAPTPWAIYAFQPAEAFIQFLGISLIAILLPLNPYVLLAFLSYDSIVNTAGHTGFEVVPKWLANSWPYKWFNTVAHHDGHHTNMRVNFGVFFNVWDRIMGTFSDDSVYAPNSRRAQRERPVRPPQRTAGKLAHRGSPIHKMG